MNYKYLVDEYGDRVGFYLEIPNNDYTPEQFFEELKEAGELYDDGEDRTPNSVETWYAEIRLATEEDPDEWTEYLEWFKKPGEGRVKTLLYEQ